MGQHMEQHILTPGFDLLDCLIKAKARGETITIISPYYRLNRTRAVRCEQVGYIVITEGKEC